MTIEIRAWECDYCDKMFRNGDVAEHHQENTCNYNPEMKRCETCVYLVRDFEHWCRMGDRYMLTVDEPCDAWMGEHKEVIDKRSGDKQRKG